MSDEVCPHCGEIHDEDDLDIESIVDTIAEMLDGVSFADCLFVLERLQPEWR